LQKIKTPKMKKFLTIAAIAAFMISCNDEKKTETTEGATTDPVAADASQMSKMADSAGSMMNNATEAAGNTIDSAKAGVEKAADAAGKAMDKAAEGVEKAADKVVEGAKEAAKDLKKNH
jgi:hypothetical protein